MSRDPEVQALLDKQAIRELLFRYYRGLDRCDEALIASVFHPDAVDDHGAGGALIGRDIAKGILERARAMGVSAGSHHITNQNIHLDGDTAGCETYFFGFMPMTREGRQVTVQFAGRYLDRLERRGGEWRIAKRNAVSDMSCIVDAAWSGRKFSYDAEDRTDQSYALLGGK